MQISCYIITKVYSHIHITKTLNTQTALFQTHHYDTYTAVTLQTVNNTTQYSLFISLINLLAPELFF